MRNLKQPVKKRIDYLDLLRVIAISGVITFHFLYSCIARGRTPQLSASPFFEIARYGYLGVELFFMISGYLIVNSVGPLTIVEFLKKRFLRLYPMYWIALLLIFTISTFGILKRPGPIAENLYYNFTMFPTAFGQNWLDAAHWFMAVQLQFYLAIALILLFKAGGHLGNIFCWWAIIGSFWYLLKLDTFQIWYFNGFFALIAGGAIIGLIRELGFNQIRVVGLLASYIWALKSRVELVHWLDKNRGPGHSALIIGLVVTFIYLAMMLTWSSRISNLAIYGAGFAGTLSYPLYLVHDRLGGLAIARFGTEGNKYFIYLLVTGCATLLAYALWQLEARVMGLFARSPKNIRINS